MTTKRSPVPAGTSVRIALMTLRDAMGNVSQLDVRRGANEEMVLRLSSGDTPLSLSNLQPRTPAPGFCERSDAETVNRVRSWLRGTTEALVSVETPPPAR